MSGIETISNLHFGSKTFRSHTGGPVTTAAFTSHEESEKKMSGIAALKYGCDLKGEMILFCFLIDVAPRGSSPPLLSPWLYLAPLSCTCLKLINHFGIIKYSKEGGAGGRRWQGGGWGRVAAGEARFKNFLNFYGMTACFTSASPSAALCFRLLRE